MCLNTKVKLLRIVFFLWTDLNGLDMVPVSINALRKKELDLFLMPKFNTLWKKDKPPKCVISILTICCDAGMSELARDPPVNLGSLNQENLILIFYEILLYAVSKNCSWLKHVKVRGSWSLVSDVTNSMIPSSVHLQLLICTEQRARITKPLHPGLIDSIWGKCLIIYYLRPTRL